MNAHPTRGALLALVVAGLLAACAPANPDTHELVLPDSRHPVVLDEQQILAEYRAETGRLQLAPGDRWDPRPAQLTVGAPGSSRSLMFEQGVGAQTAQFYWYCSWASAALADDGLGGDALAELEAFPTLSVWQHMDTNGHALFRHISDRAAQGDLDELAGYVANDC